MRPTFLIVAITFVLMYSLGFAYQQEKELTLPVSGMEEIYFDCGAGDLRIVGVKGLEQIEVKANIIVTGVSSSKARSLIKKRVKLTLERRGDRAVLTSKIKGFSFSFLFGSKTFVIDLSVRLPQNLLLDIEDRSGLIKVDNYSGDIKIEDGSGHIEVRGLRGNIEVDDGSGSIDIVNVKGNVMVDDGSGGMSITGIDGNVTVEDGSGRIYINGVEENVYIKSHGSGGEVIKNVKGKVQK